jgi:RNA polymerase sigma factor (sigma-70 family)
LTVQIDHTFLEKLKQKDVLACKQLYMQYADAMYNVCNRILQNATEAEDALQDGFIKIFDNIHQFRNESSIGSWMKQIITNTCLNILKKKKIIWQELDEKHESKSEKETESDDDTFNYTIEQIKNAIEQLPQGYRLVFNLFMFENYSHQQIAAMLEISESTSKSQLFKAKNKLKEILLQSNRAHG